MIIKIFYLRSDETAAAHALYLDVKSRSEAIRHLKDLTSVVPVEPTAMAFWKRIKAEREALGVKTEIRMVTMSLSAGESAGISDQQWNEAERVTLTVMGWPNASRKTVLHENERFTSRRTGIVPHDEHIHLVVPGHEAVTGRRRDRFQDFERGELASRCIEFMWGHQIVLGNKAAKNERTLRRWQEERGEYDRPLPFEPGAVAEAIREEAARQLRGAGHDPSGDPEALMTAWTKHCSPRRIQGDPTHNAEAEGINVEKIAKAFRQAWGEAGGEPLIFTSRCRAFGLELAQGKRGQLLALDGEGKIHSVEAYLRHTQEMGLDAKNPVDIPALLAAMKGMRLPSLAEARRNAIPAARKGYTKERGILGRQRGLARKKKDLAAQKAAEVAIEALDRRSLPLLSSPRMKPPSGDQELRKGNVHFGSDLPEGFLVRGEGAVECDRAVEAFLPRMTSGTLVIDIRGGRREDHLELTRAALKRGLKVEGGYETRTPGFQMLPAPKAKPAPAVLEEPIMVEHPKPPAKDTDIIVQLPPKTPEHAPTEEAVIILPGGVLPEDGKRPATTASGPKSKLPPRRNVFAVSPEQMRAEKKERDERRLAVGAALASALPATEASAAETPAALAVHVAMPAPDPHARQKARRQELTDYTRYLLGVECQREFAALLEANKKVDGFGEAGMPWRRELEELRNRHRDPAAFQNEVQKTVSTRTVLSIRAAQKKDALEQATREAVQAATRIVNTVWQARPFAEAAGGFDAEQLGWLGTIHQRTKEETEWLRHTEYADEARSFDFNLDPARAPRRPANESFPMTDDELDAAMAKAVFAPHMEPARFEGDIEVEHHVNDVEFARDEVVEDHVREKEEVGLAKPAQEAVAVPKPEAPAKDAQPPAKTPPSPAPKSPVLGGRETAFSPSRQAERGATAQPEGGNKQPSPAALRALQKSL